jgi:HK97 family phage major capsid protein
MALKALMLRKKIDDKKKELEALRASNDFDKREAELEASINEASTDEEKAAVEEEVAKFEAEKADYEAKEGALDEEVRNLEKELEDEEKKLETPVPEAPKPEEGRKDVHTMETRKFFNMSTQERDAFFANSEVKEFLERVRSFKGQKRDISGAELLIPTVMLGVIRENILRYSKLLRHVNLRPVAGKARQTVAGAIPEAVWTEACGKLNELSLNFYDQEVDGYKVGGFIPVCNALLEDSDINLAEEIISALGQAIGYALDKAILYGTATKMPLGIMTRLVQTAAPADYPATRRPWVDLHTTNIKSIAASVTGTALFKQIILATGAAKGKYSRGEKVFVMNETTYSKIVAESLAVNAAGAIVAGVDGRMPIVGGVIEVLDFIPDNVIIGGYFDLYLLAERAGTSISQSEHVQFIEDNTVFKGTARYDGTPVIDEAFVAIGIAGTTPDADMDFAEDTANP